MSLYASKKPKKNKKLKSPSNKYKFETRETEILCGRSTGRRTTGGGSVGGKQCENKLSEVKLIDSIDNEEYLELSSQDKRTSTISKFIGEAVECDNCSATVSYAELNGQTTTVFYCANLHILKWEQQAQLPRIDICFVCGVEDALNQNKFSSSFVFLYNFYGFFI